MTDASALRWDGAVVMSALGLTGFGVLMNYSTTAALEIGAALPPLAVRHVSGVAVALLCAVLAARMPLALWERLALWLWVGSVALLVTTLLFGLEANGARRWLLIPGLPVAIQAAEPARLATALAVAAVLANATPKRLESWALLQRVAMLVVPPTVLMLLQPDVAPAGHLQHR